QLGALYFRACAGGGGPYQIDAPADAQFTSLYANVQRTAAGGGALASHVASGWTIAPISASFETSGVVNAASFTVDLAPGSIVSIFGAGLARQGAATTVEVNGKNAPVLAAFPFQVNAQIPAETAPGAASIAIRNANGTAERSI